MSLPKFLIISWVLILLLSSGLVGCFQIHLYHDTDALRPEADGTGETLSTVFATTSLGEPLELRELCPGGVSRVSSEQTPLNGMFHYMSFGFYSPQTVTVWCKRRKYEF